MKLYIAEKPELGRAIAQALDGKEIAKNGYIEKGDNIVTWAFGHILELAEPHIYNEQYKSWNLSYLPMQIKEFKYIPKTSSKAQLKIICDLIKDSRIDSIVNCGDADDEGQILIDEIINYSKTNKKIYRVLINDLTPKAVREEIDKMRPNSEFKNLSERGFARSQADWIVGINLTRAYTTIAKNNGFSEVLSVGRVQTPILGLIVNRDLEFENFTSKEYFDIKGNFNAGSKSFKAKLKIKDKIYDESQAKEIHQSCLNKTFNLTINIENKQETPPLPYNLLILQAECAKLFGYSPDKVLEYTQELREKHKAITYNRSDCQYLPTSMFENRKSIINAINKNLNDDIKSIIAKCDLNIKSKAFDDSAISAHYGIIPTDNEINTSTLSTEILNVYTLIAKRFILQFYPNREYVSTEINVSNGEYIFSTSQTKTIKDGFRSVFGVDSEEETNDEVINDDFNLSELKGIDKAICNDIDIQKKLTKPRPYYTMTTLLKDLNSVAKYVKDERIRKLLLEKDKGKKGESGGIGTPATRSNHIKNLIDKGYIEVSKDKKQVIKSSLKGRDLIKLSPRSLSSPDMTALWFEQQKMIESGELSKKDFLDSVTKKVENEIMRIKNNDSFKDIIGMTKMKSAQTSSHICPLCNKGNLIRRKNTKGIYWWGCSEYQNGCKATYYDNKGEPQLEQKNKDSNPTPPSEKQKNFCKLISTSLNIELPNNYENDWRIANKFIKTHSGTLKKL